MGSEKDYYIMAKLPMELPKPADIISISFPEIVNGQIVPVVYGVQYISGFYLHFGGKRAGIVINDSNVPEYVAPFWIGLCFGMVALERILYTSEEEFIPYDSPHTLFPGLGDYYNDGTGDYYPNDLVDNAGNTLPYLNKLPGIAHQYFTVDYLFQMRSGVERGGDARKYSFKVRRIMTGDSPIVGADYSNGANNPVAVIYDLMTNAQYGANIPTASIDLTSFNDAAQRMVAVNTGIQMTINKPIKAREVIDSIAAASGLEIWKNRSGEYKMRAYDPVHIVGYADTMTDDDYIDFTVTKKQIFDLPNEIKGTVMDVPIADTPNSYSATKVLTIENSALYKLSGTKNAIEVDLTMLHPHSGPPRLSKIAERESLPTSTITTITNMKFANRDIMDVMMVTNTEENIQNVPYRISEIRYENAQQNQMELILEQAIESNEITSTTYDNSVREVPAMSELQSKQNIRFLPYQNYVDRTTPFTDVTKAVVAWGAGQVNTGTLVRNTDYTITESTPGGGYDRITLIMPKWTSTIEANSLGLLNIDTYEAT